MLPEYFVYIALVVNILGAVSFITQTLKGIAKPNLVTWVLWAGFGYISFAAQLSEGVGREVLFTLISALVPTLVVIAALATKNAKWQLRRTDYLFGGLALIGALLWQVTGDAVIALAFAITANILATTPTYIKAYSYPETEDWRGYAAAAISGWLTFLTIDELTFVNISFALMVAIGATMLFVFSYTKIGSRSRN